MNTKETITVHYKGREYSFTLEKGDKTVEHLLSMNMDGFKWSISTGKDTVLFIKVPEEE